MPHGLDDVRAGRRGRSRSAAHAARPGRAAGVWPLAAASTRCTSAGATDCRGRRPAPSKCCEPSRPPVRLTITDWISTFAIRSAAWTAWRIAPSAASRSTTAPPLSPSERWWPMPRMRARWVRPRSVSRFSIGRSWATRQTILLVPMSSTDRVALLRDDSGFIRGVRPLRRRLTSRPPCRASASS